MKLPVGNGDLLRRLGLWLAVAVVAGAFSIVSETFRTLNNVTLVLEQASLLGIVACGMAVMMIAGGFDLSVGATGALASVVGAVTFNHFGTAAAIAGALLVGLIVGLANGLLVARGRINPFVATFAMSSIVEGALFVLFGTNSFAAESSLLAYAAQERIAHIPVIFLIFLAVLLLVWFLLTRTKFGHYVYSVGGNAEASHLSGVPVQRVQIAAYAVGGMIASIGGLLLLGMTGTASARQSDHWPLEAIAICVVGGIALTGGIGRIEDVLAAAVLLKVTSSGLNQLGVQSEWQKVVTGLLILLAVGLDQYNRHRQRGRHRQRDIRRNKPATDSTTGTAKPKTPQRSQAPNLPVR
jgi:ribose/xylose/arabinose/galactoside ABC-type transport system permease subunit